jgi:hypothetical protein
MNASVRASTFRKIVGAGAATAALVLAPVGVGMAAAGGVPAPSGAKASGVPAQLCQLFSPLQGVFAEFESQWNQQAASQGAPGFDPDGPLPDIAGQMAGGTGCPTQSPGGAPSGLPSGPPSAPGGAPSAPGGGSGGGSSEGPQCQIFDPLTGGIEQFEQAWNAQAGSQGAPEFGDKGPFPDIAAQIASGAQCNAPSTSGGGAPSGLPGGAPSAPGGGSGGSGGGPQCQIFDPLASGVQQIEAAWNAQAGSQGAPTFGGQIPDIAAQIDNGAGCSGVTPLGSTSGSGGSNSGGSSGSGSGSGSTGGSGGSGDGASTSPSGGSSSSDSGSTLADSSGGSGATTAASGSGSLPFTGEPTWIPLTGLLALVVAGASALFALGLRLTARHSA